MCEANTIAESKPNVVFIFADQLCYSALGCNGNTVVKTPNIDRLGATGTVFDNAYSSCPICAPYRGQLLTGLYSHQNGVVCNEYKLRTDIPTLPSCLQLEGYKTAYIGKWHLGPGPYTPDKRYGFDYMAAYNICNDAYNGSYYVNTAGPYNFEKWLPEEETDLALDFITENKTAKQPFLLVMSWIPPHWPYECFPASYNTYHPEDMLIPPNVPKAFHRFEQEETALYYGSITALDAQLGRIAKCLEELCLDDNTIICFSSDHGDHLGAHGYGKPSDKWLHHSKRASKATPYDESIHIPLLIKHPNKAAAGLRSDVFFNSVDIMPTLLGLCGISVPNSVAGKDLSFVLYNESGDAPDSVYLQLLGEGWPYRGPWVGMWRGVKTHRYLYARWFDNEQEPLLFDHDNDPYEMKNLYNCPAYSKAQADMEALLANWMKVTSDPFDTGERDPKTHMLILSQEFADPKWIR